MKKHILTLSLVFLAVALIGLQALRSGEVREPGPSEYVTIRWDGRDNTHIIRPGGA